MDTECPHVACQPRGRALYPRLCLIYCSQRLHELVITTFTEQRMGPESHITCLGSHSCSEVGPGGEQRPFIFKPQSRLNTEDQYFPLHVKSAFHLSPRSPLELQECGSLGVKE